MTCHSRGGETLAEPSLQGAAWSLGVRSFGAGERFRWASARGTGSREPQPVTPLVKGASPAGDLLVVVGAGAGPERLSVERGDLAARRPAPKLFVWTALARSGRRPVPGGREAEPRRSARGELTGPAILLEIGVPQETHAEIASEIGAAEPAPPRAGVVVDLLERYVRTLAGSSETPVGPAAELVARHTAELVRAALDPRRNRAERRDETARQRRAAAVLAVIEASSSDPELCPEDVARRVGVSVRYVHRLLQGTGVRFGEHVARARLELAHAMLTEPGPRKIIDVAYDCGFKDVTHFSRRFKAHFGVTPRDARSRGRPAGRADTPGPAASGAPIERERVLAAVAAPAFARTRRQAL